MSVNIGDYFKLGNSSGISSQYNTFGDLIAVILPNVYLIAGLILLFLLIGGGFVIMTSGSSPDKKSNGAKAVTGAVVGFIIIIISYWIIQIIEIVFGIQIFQSGL